LGRIAGEPFGEVFAGNKSLSNLVWRKAVERNIVWKVSGKAGGDAFLYHLEIPPDQRPTIESLEFKGKRLFWTEGSVFKFADGGRGQTPVGMSTVSRLVGSNQQPYPVIAETLAASVEYRFEPHKMCGSSVPEPDPEFRASGENLASVLYSFLSSADRSRFQALERALHDAIPSLRGIALPATRDKEPKGAIAVEFILSGDDHGPVTIPADLVSGGALLLTAFLTLAYGKTPGLLLLEAPENGLHPFLLKLVIDLLRKISTGEVGNRKRQVIVTTHSPLLLNYAKPEEVRIFLRDQERGTQVRSLTDAPDIDKLLKEFAVGELWYLLGEEKLLEGKPA
jgi:hypothetical protein